MTKSLLEAFSLYTIVIFDKVNDKMDFVLARIKETGKISINFSLKN